MNNHRKITSLITISLMAAFLCVFSPFMIPIGPVPITLCSFFTCLCVIICGIKKGTLAYIIYLALGLLGLPVFSGFSGGWAKFFGPTGGFLTGIVFLCIIGGFSYEKSKGKPIPSLFGFILGNLISYITGTLWFMFQTKSSLLYSISVCVIPFILTDLLKITGAYYIGTVILKRLKKNI